MRQCYIFRKNFTQDYYNDFIMYYTAIAYPGAIRATDLIDKEDD